MARLFEKVVSFKVEGDLYDKDVSPESIINGYLWNFVDHKDGSFSINGHHRDSRGVITKMTKLPGVQKVKITKKLLNL